MQITIIRHGVPDLSGWEKIPSSRMPEWIKAYNVAGVKHEAHLIPQKMAIKLQHNFVVCSDLARSINSAQLIGYQSPLLIDAIFREAELPEIQIPFARLTPNAWSMVFRLFWFAGIANKAEAIEPFKQRVSLAAAKLVQLAHEHDSILLIGHGIINRFLAKELIADGWLGDEAPNGNKYGGYRYWEYATYTKT
ncbi:MAG: hypothetical protein HOO93_13155 [Methyloglobulus sp.]|nr:hypothetical protein [Methyloglobulus sp.]